MGRGYTGHEHLPWFSLINMNARLYDPLVGRFLSADPYVQAPDFTQAFNRYSYALNNPLKYTDENGEEFITAGILIGSALVGGIANLIGNWNSCNGFWEYFTAFGVGAAAGVATAAVAIASGGAAVGAAGAFWSTAGVVGVGAVGGAASGATSEIIKQTGRNFQGIEKVNWDSVGISAVAGGVGAGVGIAMSGVNLPININGTDINSPVLSSFITGSVASGAGHIAGGTTAGILWGNSFKESFHNSLNGLGGSMLVGGSFAAATTSAYDIAQGINPISGKDLNNQVTASDLGLSTEVERINNGVQYKEFKDDGIIFQNREGILPNGVSYKEYVVRFGTSGIRAGLHRIVVGSNNQWYYTPDHYHTFINFIP